MARDTVLEQLMQEYSRHVYFLRGFQCARRLYRLKIPVLPDLLRLLLRMVFSADVPLMIDVPDGVIFMHNGLGTVVHHHTVFRGPALIFHNVTLGMRYVEDDGAPEIGSYVMVGAGAAVLGKIKIGDCSVIGANAVVMQDVPPLHVAAGNPARLHPLDPDFIRRTFWIDPYEVLAQREGLGTEPASR